MITWSEQLYRIFGIEPGAPITGDVIAVRYDAGDLDLLSAMIESAQDATDVELDLRLLLPDGSVNYAHVQVQATRDSQCQLHCHGFVQDMTERRHSYDALLSLRAELAHLSRVNSPGALTT